MTQFIACPDESQLRALCAGNGESIDSESLLSHIETCAKCSQTVEDLGKSDTLASLIRQGAAHQNNADQADLSALAQRLGHLHKEPAGSAKPVQQSVPLRETTETLSVARAEAGDAALCDFLAPPQAPDELGRLGTYRVLKILGQGGMGIVFHAHDVQLGRNVALKVMLPRLAAKASSRQRFLREARAAAAIEHDHIVPIFQVGEDRGVPFIAMPLLKGESLAHRIERSPMTLAETIHIGRQLAVGLAAAHAGGLIHRDIKPDNLWLEPEATGSFRVKILDFGLARAAADSANFTQEGVIVGTPSYMAPEQTRGENVDARCDLFSLGVILYRLTTGKKPFNGADAVSTMMAICLQQPPSVHKVSPAVPLELSDLIEKLLAKKPDERPGSAAEVVMALREIERPVAGHATPDSVPVPVLADVRRRRQRRLLAAVACMLVVCAVLFAGAVFYLQTEEGTLRVKINDPSIEVSIRGSQIVLKHADKDKKIKLTPGQKTIKIVRGGFSFETDRLILKKNEMTTVEVDLLDGKIQVTSAGQALASAPLPAAPTPIVAAPVAPVNTDFALEFDGIHSVVETPVVHEGVGPLTLEAYVWADPRLLGLNSIMSDSDHPIRPNDSSGLFWDDGRLGSWRQVGRNSYLRAGDAVRAGVKTHLAGVWDGQKLVNFINGKRSMATTLDLAESASDGRTLPFVLGAHRIPNGFDHHFKGRLDEIRFSSTARYDQDFEPAPRLESDAHTLALYHCDDGKGDLLRDASPHGRNGKVVHATWVKADAPYVQLPLPVIPAAREKTPLDDLRFDDVSVETLATIQHHGREFSALVGLLGDSRLTTDARINQVVFGPDQKSIVAAGGGRGVCVYDSSTGKQLRRFWSNEFVVFDREGRMLRQHTEGGLGHHDFSTDELTAHSFPGVRSSMFALSPDGARVAFVDNDGTSIWDMKSQAKITTLQGDAKILGPWPHRSLAFDAGGKVFAAICQDKSIRVWNAETGTERDIIRPQKGGTIHALAMHPQAEDIAFGVDDGTYVWNFKEKKETAAVTGEPPGRPFVYSKDGARIIVGCVNDQSRGIKVWDRTTARLAFTLPKDIDMDDVFCDVQSASLNVSPDGKLLVCGGADQKIRIWDLETRKQLPISKGPGMSWVVAIHPRGAEIAQAQSCGIRIWDVATRSVARHIRVPIKSWPMNVVYSPDGKYLAAMTDNSFHLFHAGTGQLMFEQTRRLQWGNLAFSPDSKYLALALWNECLILHVPSGLVHSRIGASLSTLAFSADGRLLAISGLYDARSAEATRVYEWATGKVVSRGPSTGDPATIGFFNHGTELFVAASGLSSGNLAFGLDTGAKTLRFGGRIVAATPDGRYGLAALAGSRIAFLDLAARQPVGSLISEPVDFFPFRHRCAAISCDGRHAALASRNGPILIYRVDGHLP